MTPGVKRRDAQGDAGGGHVLIGAMVSRCWRADGDGAPLPASRGQLARRRLPMRNVGTPLPSGVIQSPHRQSGPTLQRAQAGSSSEGRHADRPGESRTRRIAPCGATRKGADVSLTLDPQDGGRGLHPGGKGGGRVRHTSLLVTASTGLPLPGRTSTGRCSTCYSGSCGLREAAI